MRGSIALPAVSASTIAIGWATVELDRAARELQELIGVDGRFADAHDSDALGARCRLGLRADGPSILLLEPSTEGRLAGALARFGEGWMASWEIAPRAAAETPTRPGPLGPEWLVPVPAPTLGFRLFVAPGTIRR